jgi:hypothetical protein
LSRFSHADLAAEAVGAGVVEDISTSTVRRWLHRDAIRPWRHQSWIFPRDHDFAVKAGRVLDLYARTWHGETLGDGLQRLVAERGTFPPDDRDRRLADFTDLLDAGRRCYRTVRDAAAR